MFRINIFLFLIFSVKNTACSQDVQCQYRCSYEECLDEEQICDGIDDCFDKSDEIYCPKTDRENDKGGCRVPRYPKNGRFSAKGNRNIRPGHLVEQSLLLILKCDKLFSTDGPIVSYCENYEWSVNFTCLRMCPILGSRTVDAICQTETGEVNNCNTLQPHGTTASFNCLADYAEISSTQPLICQKGRWSGKVPFCRRIIEASNNTCALPLNIRNGYYQIGGKFGIPAGERVSDVAILIYACMINYSLDGDEIAFCINGSWTSTPKCLRHCVRLSSSNVDFTCNRPNESPSSCDNYQPSGTIVTSKCKRRYSTNVPLVQLKCNDGFWNNPRPRCFIQTSKGLPPSSHIEGPCIMPEHPPNGKYVAGGNHKKVPGDSLPGYSALLTECNTGYAPSGTNGKYAHCSKGGEWSPLVKCAKTCPRLVAPHVKFSCESPSQFGDYPKSKVSCFYSVRNGTVASGDCKSSYFSDSIIPNRTCVDGIWDKPTPICKPRRWGKYIPTLTNGSCVLPDHDVNGQYVYQKNTDLTTGDIVPDLAIIVFHCFDEFELNDQNYSFCQNGMWNHLPKCLKKCKPLKSVTVHFICKFNGEQIDCNQLLKNGTTVESKCRDSYIASILVLPTLTCINGSWDKEPPRCTAECGTIIPKGQKKIINGLSTELGEFPWHVGLYDITLNYLQICGGSIINAVLVISAAHCVWDKNGKRESSDYAVAGGKYYREWLSQHDNHDIVQRSLLSDIILPNNYGGDEQNQQADIAILILETPLQFNSFVRPVCLDWDPVFDKIHLTPGNHGKVSGWGLTNVSVSDSASPVLLTQILPYVDYTTCRNDTPREFRSYLGVDKICAGYLNKGISVCRGDSGGGLVFLSSEHFTERWFLRGIISVGPIDELHPDTCHSDLYTGFTHIFSHAEWLKKEILKHIPY